MAEQSEDTEQPVVLGWHRVCLNTIVRATKELESARLRILPMGSRVNVVEVSGRRVRIDQPIDGWCSIESSNGDLILSPTQNDQNVDEGVVSPNTANEELVMQGRAEQLAKELQELRWLRTEVAATKNITTERDLAQAELQEARSQLQKLKESQLQEMSDLQSQISHLTNKVSSGGTVVDGASLKKLDRLEELEKELSQLNLVLQNKTKETEALKHKMGHIADSVPSSATSENTVLQNGDVVLLQNGDIVIIRFNGEVSWSEEPHIGVELSDALGSGNNGQGEDGVQYFQCPKGKGLFFPRSSVKKKIPAEVLLQKLHNLMKKMEREATAAE